jgi:hypothetical protein
MIKRKTKLRAPLLLLLLLLLLVKLFVMDLLMVYVIQ